MLAKCSWTVVDRRHQKLPLTSTKSAWFCCRVCLLLVYSIIIIIIILLFKAEIDAAGWFVQCLLRSASFKMGWGQIYVFEKKKEPFMQCAKKQA